MSDQPKRSQKDVLDDWILKVDAVTRNRFMEHCRVQRVEYITNAYVIPFLLEVVFCSLFLRFMSQWVDFRQSIIDNLPLLMGLVSVLIPKVANPPIPIAVKTQAKLDVLQHTTPDDVQQLMQLCMNPRAFLASVPENEEKYYQLQIDLLNGTMQIAHTRATLDMMAISVAMREREKEKDHQ